MKMIFPSRLTEEEEILQQKFALLKKKKRALHLLKQARAKPPAESAETKPQGKFKRTISEVSQEEAKEMAKKVLATQSAMIKKEKGFKRSKHLERKTKETDKNDKSSIVPFEPFNGTGEEETPSTPGKDRRSSYRPLYESFVSSSDRHQRKYEERPSHTDMEPKRGNTIYVKGYNKLSDDICQEAFQKFGTIINMNLEKDKNVAFVTFDKVEAADQAIKEMNKAVFRDIKLRVSFARRQPLQEGSGDTSSPWADVSFSRTKPKHKDKREILSYNPEDDPFSS